MIDAEVLARTKREVFETFRFWVSLDVGVGSNSGWKFDSPEFVDELCQLGMGS